MYITSPALTGNYLYYDNAFRIDLTSLGIDDLTVEDMDYYYSIYEQGGLYEMTTIENVLDMNDLIIIICSGAVWIFVIKILKEVL